MNSPSSTPAPRIPLERETLLARTDGLLASDRIVRQARASIGRPPAAAFVREAAVREADAVLAHPPQARVGSLAERLRGRATVRLSTDEIMRLTRGA